MIFCTFTAGILNSSNGHVGASCGFGAINMVSRLKNSLLKKQTIMKQQYYTLWYFLIIVFLLAYDVAQAQTWNIGYPNPEDVTATLKNDTLTIRGNGDMWTWYPWKNHNLKAVIIENGVTSIGDSAFEQCNSLVSVDLPNSVISIGSSTFWGCGSLISVDIPDSVLVIKYGTFAFCSSLVSVDIPNSVTSIEGGAFWYCPSLTSITIPNSVYVIGSGAFEGCSSLASVTISGLVSEIGNYAFRDCTSLTSVTIPSSVTSIGGYAFSGCSSLTSVTNLSPFPQNINIDIFKEVDLSRLTLTVPECALTRYQNSYVWEDFGTIIDDSSFPCPPRTWQIGYPNAIDVVATLENGILTIRGIGKMENFRVFMNVLFTPWVEVSDSITAVSIENGVTSVGTWAFHGCRNLTSVTIPNSVAEIGGGAFAGCSGLTSITNASPVPQNLIEDVFVFTDVDWPGVALTVPECAITVYQNSDWQMFGSITGDNSFSCVATWNIGYPNPKDITATLENGKLTIRGKGKLRMEGMYKFPWHSIAPANISSVVIEEGITTIGHDAFEICSSITSITIPRSVTSIEYHAFWGCSSLTSIDIPNSVTSIGNSAFYDCSNLTSVTIPNLLASIESYTFYGCRSLTSVIIPNSITSIGEEAFWGCGSLTSINIPSSVTLIGDGAFVGCSSLTSINIPNSVTSIGRDAFWNCSSLTTITIPNSIISLEGTFGYCRNLTSVTIPNSVLRIGNSTFDHCNSLTSIDIPNSVTTIGDGAFRFCYQLTSVDIPNSVTEIGIEAFMGCWRLTSVSIPGSVATIGERAFFSCNSLTSVTNLSPVPQTINTNVFTSVRFSATLMVIEGAKAAYEAADVWKDFGTIVEKSITGIEAPPLAEVAVYADKNVLYVNTPESETIYIYSVTGTPIYRETKPVGEIQIPFSNVASNILIVQGSSGWAKKVVIQDKF